MAEEPSAEESAASPQAAASAAPSSEDEGDEFPSIGDEKRSVRDEEADRWAEELLLMQSAWGKASADYERRLRAWVAAKKREDRERKAEVRILWQQASAPDRLLGGRSFNDKRQDFLREEAACQTAADLERARWRELGRRKFEEIAGLLRRQSAARPC